MFPENQSWVSVNVYPFDSSFGGVTVESLFEGKSTYSEAFFALTMLSLATQGVSLGRERRGVLLFQTSTCRRHTSLVLEWSATLPQVVSPHVPPWKPPRNITIFISMSRSPQNTFLMGLGPAPWGDTRCWGPRIPTIMPLMETNDISPVY